ncbi:MAG: hypothetical protein AAFY09_12235 [Pseudomonadota bacterium]
MLDLFDLFGLGSVLIRVELGNDKDGFISGEDGDFSSVTLLSGTSDFIVRSSSTYQFNYQIDAP